MSKKIGIIRNLDALGRVVIPKEWRNALRIEDNAPVEIYADAEGIHVYPVDGCKEAQRHLQAMTAAVKRCAGLSAREMGEIEKAIEVLANVFGKDGEVCDEV